MADAEAVLEGTGDSETPIDFTTGTLTPIRIMPIGTPTPIPGITATQILSATAITPVAHTVISSTDWITATWIYRDLSVTQDERLYQASWNNDGSIFAVGTSLGAFLYDSFSFERLRAFNLGEVVYSTVFSPGEGMLALGLFNGDIQWRAPETGEYIIAFDAHLLGVRALAFPTGSQYLVSGSDDGRVSLWAASDLLTSVSDVHNPVNEWRMPDRVTTVDIHQSRQLVAAGSYQSVIVWNINSGESEKTLSDLAGWINELAFRPSGDILAVIDSSNTIRLWDTATWTLTHQVELNALGQLYSLDFSPDGKMLALGGRNGQVVLWDLETNTVSILVDGLAKSVTDLRFSPSSETLIACYHDGVIRLWSKLP